MDINGTAKKQRKHLRQLESNFNVKTKGESQKLEIKLVEIHQQMISSNEIGVDASQAPSSARSDNTIEDDDSLEEVDQTSLFERVKLILSNKPWMLICGGITLLYYVVTGIQYWISDYMITTLKTEQGTVFISYATISVTGPVIGIVFGGNLTTYFGGYTSKLVLTTALYVAFSCMLVALPIPFISNFPLFCTLLWFLLFFGGSVLPCLTGIMLNTVE